LVKVTRADPDGHELVLAVRERGEVVGEISYLDNRARSATVTAISPCLTYIVPDGRFRRIVTDFNLNDLVFQHVIGRLRESEEIRSELTGLSSRRRIARMLLRLSPGDFCALSQTDFAKAVGLSRSAVASELAWFREQCLVVTGRRRVTITDRPRLAALADGQPDHELSRACVHSWTERSPAIRHRQVSESQHGTPEASMPDHSSQKLPPYRSILAVDTERFTRNPSSRQPDLSAAVQEVLQTAFERCELPEVWERRRFPQSTGDGYLFGSFPETTPFLVHPFLDYLHEVLLEKDDSLRAIDRGLRLRLRVSINIGPVPDSGDELRDRIGTPMNTTFRLLDCTALRDVLKHANPDVTLLASIISQRVFDDVIRGGYTPALHPDRFEQVTAEVPGKDFAEPAWIYIPRPSRLVSPISDGSPMGSRTDPRPGNTYRNVGQQINADEIHGSINYGGRSS
jgi:CRP-like cAMP-binding protein